MGNGGTASRFGCNLEAVEATAKNLQAVLDELAEFARRDDGFTADLASPRIQRALDGFYDDSSDQRKKVKEAISGLQQLLSALAEGVRAIDAGLADALPETTEQAPPIQGTHP